MFQTSIFIATAIGFLFRAMKHFVILSVIFKIFSVLHFTWRIFPCCPQISPTLSSTPITRMLLTCSVLYPATQFSGGTSRAAFTVSFNCVLQRAILNSPKVSAILWVQVKMKSTKLACPWFCALASWIIFLHLSFLLSRLLPSLVLCF